MKERIEFITESTTKGRKEISKINEYVNNFNFDCEFKRKIEQVPESYEELRSLCFEIGTKDNHVFVFGDWGKGNEYLMTHCLKFYPDGKICMDGDNVNEFVVAENKSPKQMWAIIKSLIGEE